MKKTLLVLSAALSLAFTSFGSLALACDGDKSCACAHGAKAEAAKPTATEKVSLEGTVVDVGCPMKAEKEMCTGAALVVGEAKHPIKKAGKGAEVVAKAKGTSKTVKVTGTKTGHFLTVSTYEIKG